MEQHEREMKELERKRQAARLEETKAQRALLAYRCEANAARDDLNVFLASNRQSDVNSRVKERIHELIGGKTKKKRKRNTANSASGSFADSGHKRPTSAGSVRSTSSLSQLSIRKMQSFEVGVLEKRAKDGVSKLFGW